MTNLKLALTSSGLLLALLLLATSHTTPTSARRAAKCPPTRDLEMDNCAAHMGFLGDHSFRVPKNLSGMASFCGQLKENIGCIQGYSRECLSGFTKQILNSFLKRGKQQQSSICGTDSAKNEFMAKMSTCLGDERIEQFHKCMDASIARFEFISKSVPADDRLPNLCCSYQIYFRDIEETVGRICTAGQAGGNRASGPSQAAPNHTETVKYLQKFVAATTGEFIQLVCDNHRSLDECRASDKTRNFVGKLELITKQAKQDKLKTKNKSLIPPLLEILDTGK